MVLKYKLFKHENSQFHIYKGAVRVGPLPEGVVVAAVGLVDPMGDTDVTSAINNSYGTVKKTVFM